MIAVLYFAKKVVGGMLLSLCKGPLDPFSSGLRPCVVRKYGTHSRWMRYLLQLSNNWRIFHKKQRFIFIVVTERGNQFFIDFPNTENMWVLLNYRYFFPYSMGRFAAWVFCSLGRFIAGTFCIWDIYQLGCFEAWDILYLGHFET
jgi:hypothetical protein